MSLFSQQSKCLNQQISVAVNPKEHAISVHAKSSLENALKLMVEHNVEAIVVEDNEREKRYIGLVDLQDVVAFLAQRCHAGEAAWKNFEEDVKHLKVEGLFFADMPVRYVAGDSGEDPFCTVSSHAPLYQLIEVFTQGVTRVALLDEHGTIVHLVDHLDVLNLFLENIDELGDAAKMPIKDFGLGDQEVVAMQSTEKAIAGHFLMYEEGVPAAVVLGEDGKIVAKLCAADLKGFSKENFPDLAKNVLEFIQKYDPKNGKYLTARLTTTLLELMQMMKDGCDQRVWILDEEDKPCGLVTMSGIFRAIVRGWDM